MTFNEILRYFEENYQKGTPITRVSADIYNEYEKGLRPKGGRNTGFVRVYYRGIEITSE